MEVTLNQDTCLLCVEGYKLTQNNTLCVNHILNCLDYQVTTVNADGNHDYTCTKCLDKYYVDPSGNSGLGECKMGNISNCMEYVVDRDECIKCDFGYYLTSPTTCEASNLKNISPNCEQTDSSQIDTCQICKKNYVLIEREEECELADKFKNILSTEESKCISWVNATTCSDCEPMFYGTTCEHETGYQLFLNNSQAF